jgi:hypothetical protein
MCTALAGATESVMASTWMQFVMAIWCSFMDADGGKDAVVRVALFSKKHMRARTTI